MNPPSYLDAKRLAEEICLSENAIDEWVKLGLLPLPRKHRGKRLWKWKEVEEYLDRTADAGAPSPSGDELGRIRDATRQAAPRKH